MLNTSLSPWPSFTQEEADAVSKVLLSNKVNYWTGTECREFEKEFAAFAGTQYAVALSNGTLALDVALKAMGIGAGDDVIVTSRTFLASASCIVTAGANPVFADVDLNSQNISAETIKAALTPNTKAIIVVHLAGMPAEMDSIMDLAKEHDLWVIEDCAQAHGAKYKGKSVGSIGHVGAWSFCQDKILQNMQNQPTKNSNKNKQQTCHSNNSSNAFYLFSPRAGKFFEQPRLKHIYKSSCIYIDEST